ncbi:S8 family serine peptidase [Rubellimicrobium arenae]|uniref:S8 family serine peptidase n=1 Tax=Rubellimicrobium arenae TaxID=2817372 RepID=UPI001B317A36|nr:S8 family serine peptidase [Rubellimicrobium arenae]
MRISLEYPATPDLAVERAKLEALLGGTNFDLQPLDALLPEFLVLQFPGVERRIAPDTLYAAADALVGPLQLVSAVPDVGVTFIAAPEDPDRPESVGDLFLSATCWVSEDTSVDRDWAVKAIRAPQAWARSMGTGAVVAQPDTGVALHQELNQALDLSKAFNVLDGSADPADPLQSSMQNPGHGTSTASVVASRAAGGVFGSAPGAKVAPVRCVNSVILGLDPTPVAKAIVHAVSINADVISLSLGGGFYSPAIGKALSKAANAGIIIVAAGGNCVQPVVVYPASDPNCIAMAGVNRFDQPWKGSSRGRRIDVSAPAENVYVAVRRPDDDGATNRIKPSQGTSFATALTAGVAALWVSHFGRDAIRGEAMRRGITVNDLFRAALKATARPPTIGAWDAQRFGAGIVDAERLLSLRLPAIPAAAAPESASGPGEDAIAAAISSARDQIAAGAGDWNRVGAEAMFLLNDAWMRENRATGVPMESAAKPRPSPGMQARMPAEVAAGLAAAQASALPEMEPPTAGPAPALTFARKLAATNSQGAESSTAISPSEARERLKGTGKDRLLARAAAAFDRVPGDQAAQRVVIEAASGVIDRVANDDITGLDINQRVALEALVRINDRPAYRVVDGTIAPDDPLFGEWGGLLSLIVDLPRLSAAVGRIDLDGQHIGTGFLIGPGRVMTNRHVLEACCDEIFGPGGSEWSFGRGDVAIDFSDAADGTARFPLTRVLDAGRDPIRNIEFLEHLDLAILGMSDGSTGVDAIRRPLPLARRIEPQADVMVIGFPAPPGTSAMVDPKTGLVSLEIAKRLRQVFGTDYGRKYVSPGRIVELPGGLAQDTRLWVVAHDSTTLGGSSGSAMIQITANPAVAGLHFSGAPLTANKAHVLAKVDTSPEGPIADATWV